MRRWLTAAALAAFVLVFMAPGAGAAQRARDRLDAYTAVVQADQLRALAEQGFEISDAARSRTGRRSSSCSRRPSAPSCRRRDPHPADARQGRPDGPAVRGRAGGQRLHGVALLRRARRHPRPDVRRRAREPAAGQAGQARDDGPGPRDPRGQADARRARPGGRQPSGGALQRHPARARVDRDRGQPAADELVHRPAGGRTTRRSRSCSRTPSCGSSWWPTPTATSTRSTTSGCGARTCATTTATAQTQVGDGVDPNRNFPNHWGYDDEGSSSSRPATPTAVRRRRPSRRPRP